MEAATNDAAEGDRKTDTANEATGKRTTLAGLDGGPDPVWWTAAAQEVAPTLERGSVDAIVTGVPGFWLDAYDPHPDAIGNEATVPEYVNRVTEVFAELRNALRPQGTAWLHAADSSYSGRGRGKNTKRRVRALDRGGGVGVGCARKSLLGVPWRLAHALSSTGWSVRAAIHVIRPKQGHRHAGDRPGRQSEMLFLLSRHRHYRYEPVALEHEPAADVWVLPATRDWRRTRAFPDELAERCLRLSGIQKGEVVLDPFAGTGTTIATAGAFGAHAIGIEIRKDLRGAVADRLRTPHQMRLDA